MTSVFSSKVLLLAMLSPVVAACKWHEWTLVHSSWVDSYADNIDATIRDEGRFNTADDQLLEYQQVYLECGSTNGVSVQRVITLQDTMTTAGQGRIPISDRAYYQNEQNVPQPGGIPSGLPAGGWSELHSFGTGYKRFIVRASGPQVHCAQSYRDVGGPQNNNPQLGTFGRVWARKSTEKPRESELPSCVPDEKDRPTTTATTTTNGKVEDLLSRMTDAEKLLEDQINAILPQLTDLKAKVVELTSANSKLESEKGVLDERVTELEDSVAADSRGWADRLAALEAKVNAIETTTTTTPTTTTPKARTTTPFPGKSRPQCTSGGCTPSMESNADGGVDIVACCGDVVIHGKTCSADVCELDARVAALEAVVGV